jgi:hypothetical protein
MNSVVCLSILKSLECGLKNISALALIYPSRRDEETVAVPDSIKRKWIKIILNLVKLFSHICSRKKTITKNNNSLDKYFTIYYYISLQ